MTKVDSVAVVDDVIGKAKAALLAKSRFNQAWLRYWMIHVQPCDELTFYRILPLFRAFVDSFVFGDKRGALGVTYAAQELFRQVWSGEASWTWDEAMGFAKFYEKLTRKLGAAIAHLFDYHGDGFSDLCDSLPLAGEPVVRRCLASHPRSDRPRREGFLQESELSEAVHALGPQWGAFILEGEHYLGGKLESACMKFWLHEVMVDEKGIHGWTEQEQEELSYADLGEI